MANGVDTMQAAKCVSVCMYSIWGACECVCLSSRMVTTYEFVCLCDGVLCAQVAWAIGDCVCESFPLCCSFVNLSHKVAFGPARSGAKFEFDMCPFLARRGFSDKERGANCAVSYRRVLSSSLPWLVKQHDMMIARLLGWFNLLTCCQRR